ATPPSGEARIRVKFRPGGISIVEDAESPTRRPQPTGEPPTFTGCARIQRRTTSFLIAVTRTSQQARPDYRRSAACEYGRRTWKSSPRASTLLISVYTSGGNRDPDCSAISTWIRLRR